MSVFTRTFWRDAAERGLKTAAQAAILAIGADSINAFAVEWVDVAGFSLGGLVLSLFTSIVSAGAASNGTASLLPEVRAVPAAPAVDPDATL